MATTMFRAKVEDEHVDALEAMLRKMFAAIESAGPEGVKYASTRTADGTFVGILAIDGEENPLLAVPEFAEFQIALRGWLAEPPVVEPLEVVGSYRLF